MSKILSVATWVILTEIRICVNVPVKVPLARTKKIVYYGMCISIVTLYIKESIYATKPFCPQQNAVC